MAQLRAKQIRLPAAGHLLIGGTDGNGTTLARGADNTVLKVVNGGLAYSQVAAGETTFTPTAGIAATTVQGAIAELETDFGTALAALETALEAADTALDGRLDIVEGEVSDLQTELDTTQAAAGLDVGGTYIAHTTSNYLNATTTLRGADIALDAAIKAVSDELDALGAGSLTGIQAELDATQAAVGLNADGTFNTAGVATSNYVSGTTTVMGAVLALDTALDATSDAVTVAQGEINTIISSAGLGNGGIWPASYGNAILDSNLPVGGASVTSLRTADIRLAQEIQIVQTDLDAAEAAIAAETTARTTAVSNLQAELDATQATVGTANNGGPVFYANGHYIVRGQAESAPELGDDITPDTHHAAIGKLDAALFAVQGELDVTQAGAGLSTTGAYVPHAPEVPIIGNVGGPVGNVPISLHDADRILAERIQSVADTAGGDVGLAYDQILEIATSVGLNTDEQAGTIGDFLGFTGNYIGTTTTHRAAIQALGDEAVAARANITTLQSDISNLVGLDALVFKGVMDTDITVTELEAIAATANDGDVYRFTTGDGQNPFAGGGFDVNVGDFVAFVGEVSGGPNTNTWVKFDNTDPAIAAAGGETAIVVGGNAFSGYTIAVTKNDITSANNAITVTGGVDAAFNDVAITFNPGNVNFTSLAQTGSPVDGRFLRWNATSSTIEYVTAAQLGATVATEQDFLETATRANADYSLSNAPIGDVAVFINGVKLRSTGFTVVGTTVTLVDSVNGYSVENTDLISVSYNRAA